MDANTVDIEYKYGDTFVLWPISDVHKGSKTCDTRKLKEDVKKAADTEKMIIVGVGDLLDSIIVTDKRYRKSMDDSASDAIVDDQIDSMAEILYPVRDKIVSLGDGNHEEVIILKSGTNPTQRLCKILGVKHYFGISWLLRLNFSENKSRSRSLIIRGHHGWGGGGRTQGGDLTKYSHDVKFWAADLFLYGHVHKIKGNPIEEGRMVGKNRWKTYVKKMLICGTYQRTYTQNSVSTWAEGKGFPPATIGSPLAYLTPMRDVGVDVKLLI